MQQWGSIPNANTTKLADVIHVPQTSQLLVILRSCFVESGKEMYTALTCIYTAIVADVFVVCLSFLMSRVRVFARVGRNLSHKMALTLGISVR